MAKDPIGSNMEWKKWGEIDPLFGVATHEGREKGGRSPWTDEEFYALGKLHWDQFFAHWTKYRLDNDCCVEIGCGAGRLTRHLAKSFRTVHALDVSEGMLAYARARIAESHVAFHLTDGVRIPLPDSCVSAVFSTHVFQHLDSLAHADACFAEAARVLKPGGTMMVHLPIYRWTVMPGVFATIYHARKIVGDAVAWTRRLLLRIGIGRPLMRWLSYSEDYLFGSLSRLGFADIELWIFCPLRDNRDRHPVVLARKEPSPGTQRSDLNSE